MSLVARWTEIIEDRAVGGGSDAGAKAEFRAGMRLGESGAVRDLEVAPGVIEGNVDHRTAERVIIGVAPLGDDYWIALADKIANDPSSRALLDTHHVTPKLATALAPDAIVLRPSCSCASTSTNWCRHMVAVAAAFGASLHSDPFGIVTALGSQRETIIGTPHVEATLPYGMGRGVSAPALYKRSPEPAPRVPPVAPTRRSPTALSVPPPAGSGLTPTHLLSVIDDASRRAHDFLTGAADELFLTTPVGLDVIRLAAEGSPAEVAEATGLPLPELQAAAHAWRIGGAAAARALRDRWDCPSERLTGAVENLGDGAKVRANTVTKGDTQLRLDRDGNWWRLRLDGDLGWVIESGPGPCLGDVATID